MRNTAKNLNGHAIYDLHYNKSKNTLRITKFSSSKTIVKVSNPTPDEIEFFIFGEPTYFDVKSHFLN